MQRRHLNNEEKQNEAEEEILDLTKPDYTFIPKGSHEWVQRGPYLICKSCEIEHATWIGVGKQMIGVSSDGQPILKTV